VPTPLLPPHLSERIRRSPKPLDPDGRFVLYWMRTALRAHDNPALDTALAVGDATGLPVFVYRALSRRTPYANHRHHTFILQGHRDVGRALHERGVGTAFHLERPGHDGPHLRSLGGQAALVITEDMPVEPLRGWTRGLARRLDAPVWAVDTACLAPIALVNRSHDRAFAFRDAVKDLQAVRVGRGWEDHPVRGAPFVPALPFEPVDLDGDLAALVASTRVDPSVGPVPESVGGTLAGQARWAAFRDDGLDLYAARRNDPTRPHGVSRMSAYIHYGMVSPFALAADAATVGGKDGRKWLDEFLVWREMAWHWCAHHEVHSGPAALPTWARQTLEAHRGDPRPPSLDDDTLARGRTGDELWDLCQRSLVRHGELHNNVRMTWAKQLIQWKADPMDALRLAIELNHRYALDGRDPSSYGGILWCFGGFDRPMQEEPVTGRVRSRSTSWHRTRVKPDRYRQVVHRPVFPRKPRVAVVGAGLAGAMCARTLMDHGVDVVAFDKGRGAGGRMSRRRHATGGFDHGAPSFVATDPTLARWIHAWRHGGVLAPWLAPRLAWGKQGWAATEPVERLVGTAGANTLVKHLLADVDVRFGHRATAISDGTVSFADGSAHEADLVVLTAPAPQARVLRPGAPGGLDHIRYTPCWSVWIEPGDEPDALDGVGSVVRDGHLLVREHTKPRRGVVPRWTLQWSAVWSRDHLEDDAASVATAASTLLGGWFGGIEVVEASAHRWRYARVEQAAGRPVLWDHEVVVAGDGLLGGGVEGALRSGLEAAGEVLLRLAAPSRC